MSTAFGEDRANRPGTSPGPKARRPFDIKLTDDGRALLNLGCGTRTHWSWNNVDFSPYASLRRHKALCEAIHAIGLLSDERYNRLRDIDPKIVAWDLRRGVPYGDESFDVVYHSHVLEHLDRQYAPGFLRECLRVLKRGGVLRVVIPDLETVIERYTHVLVSLREDCNKEAIEHHNEAITGLFGQMVRKYGTGTELQRPWVRVLERILRGNAEAVGESHRWMYDRHSLSSLLAQVGFGSISVRSPFESSITDWLNFELDTSSDGSVLHQDSLYVEAKRE